MSGEFARIAVAVARRNLRNVLGSPALLVPPLVAPLVFYAAFAGGLSGLGNAPGFDYPGGYTSFQFAFVLLQAMLFNGAIAGFGLARDFETGFMRRLMLSAPRRDAVLAGYVLTGLSRAALTGTVLVGVGLLTGVHFGGGALDLLALGLLCLGVALVGTLWGNGMAMRLRHTQALPVVQVPIFLLMFLSPVFAPMALITGWLEPTARGNPFTAFLEAGRAYLAGQPADSLQVLAAVVTLAAALTVLALANLRDAERAAP